ncbi:RidA family protein [Ruegeria sp. A3M17]|uniref:RidA family protein n=1 Tax=Ruegeria sp. A3M17 TaxID=2267229 RepID=UPI000DEB501B|nr:RidA family protein [Ruegeria sp. A3M17]RBW53481.1 RidA family protein [Ruegeria sp. A3M17]
MARTHIHKYQTRYHAKATYSKAIRARGDFVFMQGQVGTLMDGTLVGEGDPGAQADQACRNIQRWMEEAGGSLTDVCKLTVYVTDILYRPAVYEAINRWFEGVHHCSTGVVVQGLADPSLLVEIDAMAVIDDDADTPG